MLIYLIMIVGYVLRHNAVNFQKKFRDSKSIRVNIGILPISTITPNSLLVWTLDKQPKGARFDSHLGKTVEWKQIKLEFFSCEV